MVIKYAEFCSNPKCKYKSTYALIPGPKKFCTRCGEPIIVKCPKCRELFHEKTENNCSECGTKIKDLD